MPGCQSCQGDELPPESPLQHPPPPELPLRTGVLCHLHRTEHGTAQRTRPRGAGQSLLIQTAPFGDESLVQKFGRVRAVILAAPSDQQGEQRERQDLLTSLLHPAQLPPV